MNKNEEAWYANYEALNAHVIEIDYSPNKHDRRLNWYKYNAKLIRQGKLSEKRERIIYKPEDMRSGEHTGNGRRICSNSRT
jgi:hypothetical protein